MTSKKLTIIAVLFILLHTLSAYTPGNTIRVELRNGSVIIGKVIRTTAGSAWIKTRYGVFRVRIQSVKRKTILKKAAAKKIELPPPPENKMLKKGCLQFSVSFLPSAGEAGEGLKPGLSAAASCWLGNGILRPGFRLQISRFTGDTQSGTLILIAAEAGCRLYLLRGKTSEIFAESRAGAVLARAKLDTDGSSATGLRPAFSLQAGYSLRIYPGISLSLTGGWRMVYEKDAALHTFPVRLGVGIDF